MPQFLELLAQSIKEHSGENQEQAIVLMPGKRSFQFLKKELREVNEGVFMLPEFYAISDFFQKISGKHQADKLTLMLYLFQSYQKVLGSETTFEQFSTFGQTILNDFNEIDLYMVPTQSFFSYVDSAYALQNWDLNDAKTSENQEKYLKFWKYLPEIYLSFQEYLDAEKLVYPGKMYRQIADENFQEDTLNFLNNKSIYIAGFNALSTSELMIFDYLRKNFNCHFHWDFEEKWFDMPFAESTFFIKKNFEKFGKPKSINKEFAKKSIVEVACSGEHFQVSAVLDIFLKNNMKASETAIVMGSENFLLPLISALSAENIKSNVSMGYPLKNNEKIKALQQLQLWLKSTEARNKSWYFSSSSWKENQQLLQILPSEALAEIQHKLQQQKLKFLPRAWFENHFPRFFHSVEKLIESYNEKEKATFFKELENQILGKSSSHSNSIIQKEALLLLARSSKILAKKLEISKIPLHIDEHLSLLIDTLQTESISFIGEPTEGVQVIGILESRNISFKNVLFLGCNEGIFPPESNALSYIPYDARFSFKLPGKKDREHVYAYYFYRLLDSSENFYAFYNQFEDGDKSEKNRYLQQLNVYEQYKISHLNYGLKPPIATDKNIEIPKSEALHEHLKGKIARKISPSNIMLFYRNIFDFYLSFGKGIYEPESIDEELNSAEIGNYIHESLEKSYSEFNGKILDEKIMESISKQCMIELENAFLEKYPKESFENGRNFINYTLAQKLVSNFLKSDLHRVKITRKDKQTIQLTAQEKELKRSGISPAGNPFTLFGIADRIDIVDGLIHIFDYKTGKVEAKDLQLKSFEKDVLVKSEKAFQLLCYAWMAYDDADLKDKPNKPCIVKMKDLRNPFYYIDLGNFVYDKEKDELFTSVLGEIIDEILNPEMDFSPKEDSKYFKFFEV